MHNTLPVNLTLESWGGGVPFQFYDLCFVVKINILLGLGTHQKPSFKFLHLSTKSTSHFDSLIPGERGGPHTTYGGIFVSFAYRHHFIFSLIPLTYFPPPNAFTYLHPHTMPVFMKMLKIIISHLPWPAGVWSLSPSASLLPGNWRRGGILLI